MISKLCLLAICYFVATSARFSHHEGNGMGEGGGHYQDGGSSHGPPHEDPRSVINNGVRAVKDVQALTVVEAALRPLLDLSEDLTDCGDAALLDVWQRGEQVVVRIDCEGTDKYAQVTVTPMELKDDLTEKPTPAAKGMTGGWRKAENLDEMIEAFLKQQAGDECDIMKSECMRQGGIAGTMMYCPVKCGETVRHMNVYKSLEPTVTLDSVTDVPESGCVTKLTNDHLREIVMTSSENTFVFLKDHCLFPGTREDYVIGEGSFVDLPTGTQYCVEVSSGKKRSIVAVYSYTLEGTVPFVVAHPFKELAHCEGFMMKIASMWNKEPEMPMEE